MIASKRSKVIAITEAERQQWIDAMQQVWKKFEGQIGASLIEAAVQANTL